MEQIITRRSSELAMTSDENGQDGGTGSDLFRDFDHVMTTIYHKAVAEKISLQQCSWTMMIVCQYLLDKHSASIIGPEKLGVQAALEHITNLVRDHVAIKRRKQTSAKADIGSDAVRTGVLRAARHALCVQACDRFWKTAGYYASIGPPAGTLTPEKHFGMKDEFDDWSYTAAQLDSMIDSVLQHALHAARREKNTLLQNGSLAKYIKDHRDSSHPTYPFLMAILVDATIQSYQLLRCPELTRRKMSQGGALQRVQRTGRDVLKKAATAFNHPILASTSAMTADASLVVDDLTIKAFLGRKNDDVYTSAPLTTAGVECSIDLLKLSNAHPLLIVNTCVDSTVQTFAALMLKDPGHKSITYRKYQNTFTKAAFDSKSSQSLDKKLVECLRLLESSNLNAPGSSITFDLERASLLWLYRKGTNEVISRLLCAISAEADALKAKVKWQRQLRRGNREGKTELQILVESFEEAFGFHFTSEVPLMEINFADLFVACADYGEDFENEVRGLPEH